MARICRECKSSITDINRIKYTTHVRNYCQPCFTLRNRQKERDRKGIIKHPCETCKTLCYRKSYRAFCSDACKFFWYVEKTDSCWNWIGAIDKYGYGKIKIAKNHRSHRYSYELHNNKKLNSSIHILHSCDNRKCVNPDHLKEGTHKDNIMDMVNKNRHLKGSQIGTSKLHETDVVEIKKMILWNMPIISIANKYNVCESTIGHIKYGRYWKHI